MSERYFSKFNTITYANTKVVDITNRSVILDMVYDNPYVYYDYDSGTGVRPDQIADAYYEDQYMDWVVYLGNKIVDPYYGWYMNDEQMRSYMFKKYGSQSEQQRVMYYENDWASADDITESAYAALTVDEQRYWEPRYNNGRLVSYMRVQESWRASTNRVVKYLLNSAANAFVSDELLTITIDAGVTGKAQVALAIGNTLVVQHVSGQYMPSNSHLLTANSVVSSATATATIIMANTIAINIPDGEEQYWRAITADEFERERNESNRNVKLVDSRYSRQLSKELTRLMRET